MSNCIDYFFSPCGTDRSKVVVGWVVFDWANSATLFSYSLFQAILINDLGDEALGMGAGKIFWSYLSVAISIITAILYMTFTALIEYGCIKRKALVRCGVLSATSLILFLFCFLGGSVYIAGILAVVSSCSQRIADVAYDSLLDAVAKGKDAHQISTRGYTTGYIGMLVFLFLLGIFLYIIYITINPSTLWLTGIIPIVASGVWYLGFLHVVSTRLPLCIGIGLTLPDELKGSYPMMFIKGLKLGFLQQFHTLLSLYRFQDLGLFILSMAFISDAAATATSAAAIYATSVLNLGLVMIALVALVGVFGAVAGLLFYKSLHHYHFLTPKQIIIINIIVLCIAVIFVLFITSTNQIFIIAAICGTQIGALGSFSRSIISRLLPTLQQSRYFSLYKLTQKGSGWVGPLIIAALTQTFGNNSYLRVVVIVTLVEALIGLPIFFAINILRGEALRAAIDQEEIDHNNIIVLKVSDENNNDSSSSSSNNIEENHRGGGSSAGGGSDSIASSISEECNKINDTSSISAINVAVNNAINSISSPLYSSSDKRSGRSRHHPPPPGSKILSNHECD